ncbi:TPA: DUF6119 family protein [Legionella pneumophila]|nr:hypothetical protein [Legionella pneumophila]
MTTKYNIYKILIEKRNELVKKLARVGLKHIGSQSINNWSMDFYFSIEPDEIDIWWTKTYVDFFGEYEPPKNKIYFAVLLVYSEDKCYAVSLGKSHFYLKNFSNLDFGLNLAERIADANNLKIKNSKFYKSKKHKIVTTYQEGSDVDFDSGESTHYLKANTVDKDIWGKTASFGHSVLFNVDIEIKELPYFIEKIESALQQPQKISIPRVVKISDENEIKRLDQLLAEEISSQENSTLQENLISLSGVDFIFSDQLEYSIYLPNIKKAKTPKGELNLATLNSFLQDNNIHIKDNINNIKVKIYNEFGRSRSVPLKELIDFIDEENRCCLIDAMWYKFNQKYIDFLQSEVDSIELEIMKDLVLDSTEGEFNRRHEKLGYVNCDKICQSLDKKYKVEKMDLFKESTLFFVKFGNPQKLNYVIDQAINTVKAVQNNQIELYTDQTRMTPKTICLWIVLDRKTKITKISDLNSLIFHMKLNEWKNCVKNAGLYPRIILGYKGNQ